MLNALKNSITGKRDPQPETPETPEDLRMAMRDDVFADVIVATGIGQKKQGIALDVSHCGARLRFVSTDSLTENIVLEVPRLRLKRRGRVRWKTRTDVGIEYID